MTANIYQLGVHADSWWPTKETWDTCGLGSLCRGDRHGGMMCEAVLLQDWWLVSLKSIWGVAQNFVIIFGTAGFTDVLIFERIYSESNGGSHLYGVKEFKKERARHLDFFRCAESANYLQKDNLVQRVLASVQRAERFFACQELYLPNL